jgi:hypothetical protein
VTHNENARGRSVRRFGALIVVALLIAAVYGLVRASTWGFVNLAIGGSLLAALLMLRRR